MGAFSHISNACTILVYDLIEHAFTSVMIPLGGVPYHARQSEDTRAYGNRREKLDMLDLLDRDLPFSGSLSRCLLFQREFNVGEQLSV